MGSRPGHNNRDVQAAVASAVRVHAERTELPDSDGDDEAQDGRRGSRYGATPPLTQGEIADRISILELKSHYENSDTIEELIDLTRAYRGKVSDLEMLRKINKSGWLVVGAIHNHFDGVHILDDKDIIESCRAAHAINRDRVRVKNEINDGFGERLEFKTWKPD